jgi:hypothetical protein
MAEITISLDGILDEPQIGQIQSLLRGIADAPLADFCRAAIAESADAILTRRQESASVTPQHRLYRLIKHAFKGKIPSETAIGALFGIPDRRALTMITNVTKRYSADFASGWKVAIEAAFADKSEAKSGKTDVYRFSAAQAVIDHLKETVAGLENGKLAPLQKVKETAERYEIPRDTYDAVRKALGIPN